MGLASALYRRAALTRRRWYAARPWIRRRLWRPVISVGNLSVGGTGKTPLVAHLCAVLKELGERPSVLSRGYGRRDPVDGVVVVSDGRSVRADLDRAGDEPLMLARAAAGVIVVVSPDRYLAGRLAELRLGCTVHVLDDGFQHVQLERDVDLLILDPDDVTDPRLLPAGRLREPLDHARLADAVIVHADTLVAAQELGARLGLTQVFRAARHLDTARLIEPPGRPVSPTPGTRVLAVAGVAKPRRFFRDLREAGWAVAGEKAFADHYVYRPRDIAALAQAAEAVHAVMLLTTEKDAMRLLPLRPLPLPVAWVPLQVTVEPEGAFREWLTEQLVGARLQEHRREF